MCVFGLTTVAQENGERTEKKKVRKLPLGWTGKLYPPSFRIRQQEELLSQHCYCSLSPVCSATPLSLSVCFALNPEAETGVTQIITLKFSNSKIFLQNNSGTELFKTCDLKNDTIATCFNRWLPHAYPTISSKACRDAVICDEWISPLRKLAHCFS